MPIHAISRYYQNIADCITTKVKVINPYSGDTEETIGIWDTGATNSCISKSLPKKLNLEPVQRVTVLGVHGTKETDAYYATVVLHNENVQISIPITECDELSADGSVCMLIGMDIITKGDFCITNLNGKTVMTDRSPSVELIDWVADISEENRIHKITLFLT